MGFAFLKMTTNSQNQKRYYSRSYEIAKLWFSQNNPSKFRNLKGKNNPMYGVLGENHHRFGTHHTNDTKDKISKVNKGKLSGDKNPSKRQEVKDKISKSWGNRKFQYIFVTPWGEYTRAPQAAKDAPYPVTSTSILNWCKRKYPREGFTRKEI